MPTIQQRKRLSKHPINPVGTALIVAGLLSLIGCQGLSSAAHQVAQEIGNLTWGSQSLSFGGVTSGSSKTMTVVATNSGNASLNITSATFSTQYFTLASALPVTIAPGQNATLSVKFTPNAAGTFSAVATFNSNASNSVSNIALSGTGSGTATGSLTINPISKAFGNVTVGNSAQQTWTLTNSGTASVDVSQISLAGSAFQLSGITAPLTLNATQSTTFTITFAPQSAASDSGILTITSNASDPTMTIPMSGTGVAATTAGQLAVSPSPLGVGSVVVGSSGTASGSLSASGSSVKVTAVSTSNSAFSVSGLSLPATIPAGQSVPFTITFSPQSTGSASATLTVTSNAQTTSSTDTLTGTGTAAPTHTVSLSWNASTSSEISGYNVYRAPYSGSCGSFAKINPNLNTTTLYTDSSVADGSSYCYATTAVNTSSEESGYSNIVSDIQIPAQ